MPGLDRAEDEYQRGGGERDIRHGRGRLSEPLLLEDPVPGIKESRQDIEDERKGEKEQGQYHGLSPFLTLGQKRKDVFYCHCMGSVPLALGVAQVFSPEKTDK